MQNQGHMNRQGLLYIEDLSESAIVQHLCGSMPSDVKCMKRGEHK